MSMNLYIGAYQKATLASGKELEHRMKFNLYQTPTNITYEALKGDALKVYSDYAREISEQHVKELTDWIKQVENDGYTIEFYTI